MADTGRVNGLGIGTTVGLGALIGLGIVAPGAQIIEYLATFAFYGMISGLLFELYRFAFTFKRPFSR
jgi:hypothetical protein